MPTINRNSPKRPWVKERKPFGTVDKINKKFYDSKAWKDLRNAFRMANPLCKNVDKCGGATHTIDHIIPIRDGGKPLDWSNLQSLCEACNASKTGGQSWKKKQKE